MIGQRVGTQQANQLGHQVVPNRAKDAAIGQCDPVFLDRHLLRKRHALGPGDVGLYPWASVQLSERANVDMCKLFGVPADAPLPLALEARAWNIKCAIVQLAVRTASPLAQHLIDLMRHQNLKPVHLIAKSTSSRAESVEPGTHRIRPPAGDPIVR
jgi:hypothetical protein